MAKPAKIDDVKRPDKVTPSATGRPIIVANHSTLRSDPMMAPHTERVESTEAQMPSEPLAHAAKTIQPLHDILIAPEADGADVTTESSDDTQKIENKDADTEIATKPAEDILIPADSSAAAPVKEEASAPQSSEAETKEVAPGDKEDSDAAVSAAEAAAAEAKAKREEEIEAVIASGKYEVPINAVQRRRSRLDTILLCVLALLLAVILLDLIADVGIVHAPSGVPHTHFFSK